MSIGGKKGVTFKAGLLDRQMSEYTGPLYSMDQVSLGMMYSWEYLTLHPLHMDDCCDSTHTVISSYFIIYYHFFKISRKS